MAARTEGGAGPVSVDLDVEAERTIITVSGTHEAAVVVRSASGERIYLPPEESDEDEQDSPYRPAGSGDSPYDGVPDESPYGSARSTPPSVGLTRTAEGFRIVHPEPVTDFRILR